MIPKNIFFIWFGNIVPKYFAASVEAFSNINRDFNIEVIYKTHKDLDKIKNRILNNKYDKALLQNMLDIENDNGIYKESILHYKLLRRSTKQILSNIFRLYLLNQYGGIYIDGDCFPIKPFDNELLLDSFVVHHTYTGNILLPDCFFMGKTQTSQLWKSYWHGAQCSIHLVQQQPLKTKCDKLVLQKKFINGNLQYGDFFSSNQNYLDHYNLKTWQQ